MKALYVILGIGIATLGASWLGVFEKRIDYNTEVKPILNKNCMACHGGVKKAGDVSFLFEEEMLKPGKSGKVPVVRGDAHASEMIRRILSDDPDERMPKKGPGLSDEEVSTLKKWIDQGAKWGNHWAYERVERPEVPQAGGMWSALGVGDTDWPRNPIDQFVYKKFKFKNLDPAPEADRATLIRRVSLDLTGLPPTPQEARDFIDDPSKDAYEKVVDRLLASPAYGERWAALWMDLARYADTKGYEADQPRTIWRYRDYVITSFNQDKPFDQFTIEQLAGDLLLDKKTGFPTDEQLVATGFHRNTMTNDEGGTVNEEFRVAAQIDRVNTTWEVWQGTTFGCVQCHSHPYDPIPHEDYYKYMAYFNSTRDEDMNTETPKLRFFRGEDSVRLERVKNWVRERDPAQVQEIAQFARLTEPKINSHSFDRLTNSLFVIYQNYGAHHKGSARVGTVPLSGKRQMVVSVQTPATDAVMELRLDSLQGPLLSRLTIPATRRDTVLIAPIPEIGGTHDLYVRFSLPTNPNAFVTVKWVSFQKAFPEGRERKRILRDYAALLTESPDAIPVLWEGKGHLARKTHVFERGNWLVLGQEVRPDVPKALGTLPAKSPANRLTLARWLVSRDNPLTARVMVNRLWEQLFGLGIVETVEDFGSQGSEPTHRELLDWLAVTYMEDYGWSTKKLLKEIVTSATYRQDSETNEEKQRADPYNYWLARGPRVRLSAEQVRDQALAVSGLLSKKMYGPSVMPPQPEGIWQSPYNGAEWRESEGEDRYRRALYTYWKRTAPYPSMVTFDAPSREFCQSRRIRTNTPLQALVTLNDPVYLESARRLAVFMQQKARTPAQQLGLGYRQLTYRPIESNDLSVLLKVYQAALREYKANPQEIDSLLRQSRRKSPELAALTVSANVLLNLDEVVTKE